MDNGSLPHDLESQLRDACAELDRRLRQGADCRAEQWLEQNANLASHPEAAVELIYTEFVTREILGQQPSTADFLRRFPHFRDALQEQFQVHALINTVEDADTPARLSSKHPAFSAVPGDRERMLGSYELLEETARGAMGVIYRARHRPLNRTVALKMILAGAHASRADLARFRTEAEAVARLQHPNIVQIYEVGDTGGHPFLSLEFVAGGTLAQKLTGNPQSPRYAAELVTILARAIHYAHQQGILHRDLKPANVLLALDGTPKITDFGLAKVLDHGDGQTESGAICGTPSYMAPEQAAGRTGGTGPAVDIYALGAILYELLTGQPPFRAETLLKTLSQVVGRDAIAPDRLQPSVPHDLATICMKCLQKDPRRRYRTAAGLAADLERYLAGEPIQARPISSSERVWKWAKRRPAVAALLVVLGLAACALFFGNLWYTARLRAVAAEAQYERNQAQAAASDAEHQRNQAQAAADEARKQRADAQAAASEAERQKAQANRQTELVKKQYGFTRRLLFTIQLAQVEETWKSDPARALRLLLDEERCPRDLRDFAWGMYHHLCCQDRVLTSGHARGVTAVAFAPDGKTLATAGGDDASVKLWDAAQGCLRLTIAAHAGRVTAVAFSPDGRTLATAGEDRAVRLWFSDTGKKQKTLRGHGDGVLCLAFAPNGKSLATGSRDRTARQWDVATGKQLLTLTGHTAPVLSLAFTPDSELLATGSEDASVRFWDLATLATDKERNTLKLEEQGPITCVAFSPDGKKLAVAGARRAAVDLFDMETLSLQTSFRGHVDRVHAIGFSADGKLLASGSADHTVRLWEVDSGAQRYALQGHAGPVQSVAFARGSQTLASAGDDGSIWLWAVGIRAETQRNNQDLSRSWSGRFVAMAYARDGKTLATGDHDGTVKLWDPVTRRELASLRGHAGPVWSLVFSKDSKLLATCGEDGKVKLWDVPGRKKIITLLANHRRARAVAFSPGDKTLATGGEDGIVRLWDVAKRRERSALPSLGKQIFSVGFAPDGNSLVVGTEDGRVRLWNLAAHRERATLAGHQKAVLFALFSPDGKTLATGGLDNTVQLWDSDSLSLRATLLWNAGYVFSVAFTPDGRTLATGGGSRSGSHLPGEVKLWDVTTGHCHAVLPGQTGPIAFSPDGRSLATVSNLTNLRFWTSALQ
jgi:eukaryotic-like serine/threonine-protein kinase